MLVYDVPDEIGFPALKNNRSGFVLLVPALFGDVNITEELVKFLPKLVEFEIIEIFVVPLVKGDVILDEYEIDVDT
jgi:hypothetical protein